MAMAFTIIVAIVKVLTVVCAVLFMLRSYYKSCILAEAVLVR